MSEFASYNPNTVSNASNLPHDFLRIDQHNLAISAGRLRSMADLQQGLSRLNGNFVVASVVSGGCRQYEDPDALRHVTRGAALTQILLEDSVRNFAPDASGYIADITALEPQPNPRRDNFQAAREELVEARRSSVLSESWQLSPGETAQNEGSFRQRVDEVLDKAGLRGSLEIAIQRLSGVGLEEPTRELDAKYGAALVALGIGITEG